jgi:hypothetical protein
MNPSSIRDNEHRYETINATMKTIEKRKLISW